MALLRIVSIAVLISSSSPAVASTDFLPADPAERAFVCDVAVQVEPGVLFGGRLSFVGATRAAQFEGLRLSALPDGGWFAPDRRTRDWDAQKYGEERKKALALFDKHVSTEVRAACDAAYPETLADFQVVLPTEPDDRFLTCEGLNVWMLTSGYKDSSYPELKPYIELSKRFGPLFAKFVESHGLKPGPELSRVVIPPIGRALKLGRPDKVLDACVTAYPATAA
jgi:hypothetical protein